MAQKQMIIGALRLTFAVSPSCPSPGNSHGVAQKIKDRLWSKFKVALAELPSRGSHDVIIGGAIVGHDEAQTRERIDQIVQHLRDWGSVELVDDETEMIYFEDLEMERSFEKYDP